MKKQARVTSKGITAVRTGDRFEKFRGIGTPGITGNRKGIVRWLRQQRGG